MKGIKIPEKTEVITMKKIIKKSIALILVVITILSLAACGGASSSLFIRTKVTSQNDSEEPVAILDGSLLKTYDANMIAESLKEKFPDEEIGVVPVYSCENIFMNGEIVHIIAIDSADSKYIGLDEMDKDTAYFAAEHGEKIELDISVITEENEDGIESAEMKKMPLEAKTGVSEKMLLKTLKEDYLTPSTVDDTICFVTTETFVEICSVIVAEELSTIEQAEDASRSIELKGIYISADNSKDVEEYINSLNYYA